MSFRTQSQSVVMQKTGGKGRLLTNKSILFIKNVRMRSHKMMMQQLTCTSICYFDQSELSIIDFPGKGK